MQTPTKVAVAEKTSGAGLQVCALRFTGDISSASKEAVVGTYQGLSASANPRLLLDFTAVDYLNSSGIALVIHVLMEASKVGQTVAICGLSKHFTKVFTMVGIPKYASLYADEGAALAAM